MKTFTLPKRKTSTRDRVLAEFGRDPERELSGADLIEYTGLSGGTIYPMLRKFTKEYGWLTSRWDTNRQDDDRPRRLYKLTGLGQPHAAKAAEEARETALALAGRFLPASAPGSVPSGGR